MIDFLGFFIVLLVVASVLAYVGSITDDNIKKLFFTIGIIVLLLFTMITYNSLIKPEYYKIDKNIISMQNITGLKDGTELHFNKKLKVEKLSFDMPYSSTLDYSIYRIYLDSTTYIDIWCSKFDSVDLKKGKKLYK